MKRAYCLVVMSVNLLVFFSANAARAAEGGLEPAAKIAAQPTMNAHTLELEQAKFEFNRQLETEKLEFNKQLERDKLAVEEKKTWFTVLSFSFPLVLGVFTLWWQSKSALDMKKKDASDAFQLKAAELVLASATGAGARSRAEALKKLFPEYLPSSSLTRLTFLRFRASEESAN